MKIKYKKLPELSLFFPAYNEEGNIEKSVKQALAVLPSVAQRYEVIIVDDGSTDNTLKISKKLTRQYEKIKVVTQENKGYGGALKRGFAEAKYEWIFFTDSDLQFDLANIANFVKSASSSDLIIGYRLNRADGRTRELLTKGLKIWNLLLFGLPFSIKDFDCAFKLIHRNVLSSIEPLFSDGAMLSTELLLKANRAGCSVIQIGVNHFKRHTGSPTGNNINVIFKAVKDSFVLKWLLFRQSNNPISIKHRLQPLVYRAK
ncbi:MAG: glycosyltransferase family 2 protein [Bacteroidota bacterium]